MEENRKGTSAEGTGTESGVEGQQGAELKTFTQDEVNRIVQERLAREKGKGTSNEELEKRAAELDRRERKLNAVTKLREKGLPDDLVDVLNFDTDDSLDKAIEKILELKGKTEGAEPGTVVIGRGNPIGTVTGQGVDSIRTAFGLK